LENLTFIAENAVYLPTHPVFSPSMAKPFTKFGEIKCYKYDALPETHPVPFGCTPHIQVT